MNSAQHALKETYPRLARRNETARSKTDGGGRPGESALTRGLARTTGTDETAPQQQVEQLIFLLPSLGPGRVRHDTAARGRRGDLFTTPLGGRRDDDDEGDAAGARRGWKWKGRRGPHKSLRSGACTWWRAPARPRALAAVQRDLEIRAAGNTLLVRKTGRGG
jgi:hypothetical protein